MAYIVSWNVNSVKSRLEHLSKLSREHHPSVILLQETKSENDKFPRLEIEDLGYNIALNGQKSYNGVAILSKSPIEDVFINLVHDETEEFKNEARYIDAITYIAGNCIRVASVYVPQGTEVGTNKFKFKLRFYNFLKERFTSITKAEEALVAGGDYNVAPDDIDVYDPKYLDGSLGFHIEERKSFRSLLNEGFYDSFRLMNPNKHEFSWWDYRSAGWQHNKGMRIDQIIVNPIAADKLDSAGVFTEFRGLEKASDHAPIYVKMTYSSLKLS